MTEHDLDLIDFPEWSQWGEGHDGDRRKRPVVRSDGKRYESESDAARDVIGDQTNIGGACRKPKRTAYGYRWRYA